LQELRDFAAVRSGNSILLGEVDVGLSTLSDYFGGGNELHALFNFAVNRYLFLGLAQESADAIKFGLRELPSVPGEGQWVNFLRHHDELNLSRLTDQQRSEVLEAMAPEASMQIYGRGARRRLAPMLGGDPARLKMAYSLLFSLPGAPMVFYGEEIGMGENLAMHGRLAVRTPMQWAEAEHGGFSTAKVSKWVRQPPETGDYTMEKVNVANQRGDRDSLLNHVAALARARRECSEIGNGRWSICDPGAEAVLAMRYDTDDSCVAVWNNLSGRKQKVAADFPDISLDYAHDLLADRGYPQLGSSGFTLEPYGFRWVRLAGF
jgi:maltose alpha-D-glucosyltransferase/alpha-amylase